MNSLRLAVLLLSSLLQSTQPAQSPDGEAVRTVAPRVLHTADPPCSGPQLHLNAGDRVSALIGLKVDERGNPVNIHIVRSGSPEFNACAIKAVEQYRFAPATRAGQPVQVEIKIEVNFQRNR